MNRNWPMSVIAVLVGAAMFSLAALDYASSPANHKGIGVGPVFFSLSARAPGTAARLGTPGQARPGTAASAPSATGKPTSPGTSPSGAGITSPLINGTWVLQQANNAAMVDSKQVETALATPHIRGYSMRVPWSAIDGTTALLDQGLAVAKKHNIAFAIRFMAGRYTPARVLAAGPHFTLSGTTEPLPFNANGTPNTVFETAYKSEVALLAAWSRKNGVHLLHLPWYGALWNEFYLGPGIISSPGYTYQAWLSGHQRLAQIAYAYAGSDLTVEFPLSGIDNSGGHSVYRDLTLIANALASAHPTWLFVQTNGLGQSAYGMNIFGRGILVGHAQQMFAGGDYNWVAVFAVVRASADVYVEIYATSFDPSLPHHAALMAQILLF